MAKSTAPQPSSQPRQPVVVIMGHVDHGKTTLLDYIRKANVAAREVGGITQATSAYEVVHAGKSLTFIDTPGHEAFSGMRSRGARVADLAVLVIAATEGVKPQTAEAIKILKESETTFVVAITKIDMPGADVDKIKNELFAQDVLLEGYGGSISFQALSSVTGEGVPELLDLLLLAAEVEEFVYDPSMPASGFVLEARRTKQRGVEATVLIKEGVLRFGDTIASPSAQGKVKILETFAGLSTRELHAGQPAIVIGLDAVPRVGEQFATGAHAATIVQIPDEPLLQTQQEDWMFQDFFPVVLKAADLGSLEVLEQIIMAVPSERPLKLIGKGVGDVNDTDAKLAISARGVILGFKTKTDKAAQTLLEANRIPVLASPIIYEIVQQLEALFKAAAGPDVIARLEVLALFNQKRLDEQLVGGRLTEGTLRAKLQIEIIRGDALVGKGRILSLRQQKQQVDEVTAVTETGVLVNASVAIEVGDVLAVRARS